MRMDKIICHCKKVTIGDIANAVNEGAKTFEEVQEKTSVSRGCKRCTEDAKRVIEELVNEQNA